mmetsp:Transcript_29136/g.63706  ORF Transcript_29136/g.63706 Transcript_29136/m.63706 type:complete len:228 (+) Transcript_29136:228-911(+)
MDSKAVPPDTSAIVSEAEVCWMKQLMTPLLSLATSLETAFSTSAVMSWQPREGAVTVTFFCTADPAAGSVKVTSLECPTPKPPTSRCSHRYTPCHVPSWRRPRLTGTLNEAPTSVLFTCAGMSSGPSKVCSKNSWFQDSGTMWLKAASMSVRTVGSAFSFMVRDAEVCRIDKFRRPTSQFARPGTPPRVSVTRWQPRLGAFTVMFLVSRTFPASSMVTTSSRPASPA